MFFYGYNCGIIKVMKKNTKKKVLIVGSGAAAYATAKQFASYENIEKVYVSCTNHAIKEFAHTLDIREDNVNELLEFVLENAVDLTVVLSPAAIKADIATIFQTNNQQIFAPSAGSAEFALSRGAGKRFLYKHHIPTPRFGIYEKPSMATDYLKKVRMPVIITPDEINDNCVMSACTTVDFARVCIDDMTLNSEEKIIIEEFVNGHNFTIYVITDGYQTLPLAVCGDYKFLENGDGGLLTCGSGAFVPDYKVSGDIIGTIMQNVNNMLASLERNGNPYMGILGVECVLTDFDKFVTTGFTTFIKDHDAQAVLNSVNENLYTLFEACAVGSFADDYEYISCTNSASVAAVLFARNDGEVIEGLDCLDDLAKISYFTGRKNDYGEYETNKGRTLVVTQEASTLSRAVKLLYENIDEINFKGKKFRSDICS